MRFDEVVERAPRVVQSSMNCTVVSILPFPLKEHKPQIHPGYFAIPSATEDEPIQCLPIGESIHWMESPFPGMPPIRITETSKSMARSVVNDYIEAQLAIDTNAFPGLFWVEGHYDSGGVKHFHLEELERIKVAQNNWFINLVRIADDDWQKAHQHQAISDKQRFAAKALGILDREWLSVTVDAMMTRCPLCSGMVTQGAVVHAECGYIIDLKRYEQMQARIIKKADRLIVNPLAERISGDSLADLVGKSKEDLEFLKGEKK